MKNFVAICLGMSLSFATMGVHAQMQEPDALIRDTVKEVLDVVKQDKDIKAGNQKKILELVDAKVLPHFNFERMTRLAVGKAWRSASAGQRATLVAEFRTLLVRTYTNAFTGYRDQTVEVKPFKMPAGADEVTIKTIISKPGGQPIAVDYEMEKTPNGWKAFDLIVEGASLVTTYRSTFGDLVQQNGVDGLIKSLQDKNQALASTPLRKADSK